MTLGELGTETFVEFTESSGKEVWLEISAAEADTSAAGSFFLGFAEEGTAITDIIADAGDDVGQSSPDRHFDELPDHDRHFRQHPASAHHHRRPGEPVVQRTAHLPDSVP